jgi:hypothetical protein
MEFAVKSVADKRAATSANNIKSQYACLLEYTRTFLKFGTESAKQLIFS